MLGRRHQFSDGVMGSASVHNMLSESVYVVGGEGWVLCSAPPHCITINIIQQL